MNNTLVKDILSSYTEISIENEITSDIFMLRLFGKQFLFFAPIENEANSFPSVYLHNDEGFDFPHVMLREHNITDTSAFPEGSYRWVCLYENESLVYSIMSTEEKIRDSIDRLIELLSMSKTSREHEFQKEFLFYWNYASVGTEIELFLSQTESFCKLEKYVNKSTVRYIDSGLSLNDQSGHDKNGNPSWLKHVETDIFFVPIIDIRGILPPHKGLTWTIEQVKEIVFGKQIDHISPETYKQIETQLVKTQNVNIVFGMPVDNTKITYAVRLKCNNRSNRTLFEKISDDTMSIELLYTKRRDYNYLCEQIRNDIMLRGKRVLLIGAGSLGSYIAMEIVKNGASSLDIYDGDSLVDENTLRWSYALGNTGNKAAKLELLLELLHPQINVTAFQKNFSEEDAKSVLDAYDIVICATGGSDTQLEINRILKNNNCHVPVFFTWLEAGGDFSHIFVIDYAKPGCMQCLYTDASGNLTNNRSDILSDTAADTHILRNGCGGTRAAYGTAVLLRTTAALLSTLSDVVSGKVTGPTLLNITPNNMSVSEKDMIVVGGCSCCGIQE